MLYFIIFFMHWTIKIVSMETSICCLLQSSKMALNSDAVLCCDIMQQSILTYKETIYPSIQGIFWCPVFQIPFM